MLGIHVDVAAHCQHPVPERAADVAHCLAVGVQPPGDPVFPLIGDEVDKAGLNLVLIQSRPRVVLSRWAWQSQRGEGEDTRPHR